RLLDRYIPRRDPQSPPAERYRTTKPPQELSPLEKIARNTKASMDPFSSRNTSTSDWSSLSQADDRAINRGLSLRHFLGPLSTNHGSLRQVSQGAVWAVGGLTSSTTTDTTADTTTHEALTRLVRRRVNTRAFSASFHKPKLNARDDLIKHEGRIAMALDIDRVRKVFDFDHSNQIPQCIRGSRDDRSTDRTRTMWDGCGWMNGEEAFSTLDQTTLNSPFRVLNAPHLKDDFYCSPLAYTITSQTLAVCLGNFLYAWSEEVGVQMMHGAHSAAWLTSIAFSSTQGAKAILAIGQSDGCLVLRSVYDGLPRFEVQNRFPIACVSWRPRCTLRPSKNPFNPGVLVQTEDLIVGDEVGILYYYAVEWPMAWEVSRDTWPGSISLLTKISVHSQQICGLAWAPDGALFASGGNDNLCHLFEVDYIFDQDQAGPRRNEIPSRNTRIRTTPLSLDPDFEVETYRTSLDTLRHLGAGVVRHRWVHGAAVKAIAFCPWRHGLLATGGGSNDKCIHFFHTSSGAALATIHVSAQVTSLIWSTTRREILATFGYPHPEHPYRIAVFSWPDCKQVAAIPWQGEPRALYAISYAEGPLYPQPRRKGRAAQEGCIVVASSDRSVKFYEVWGNKKGGSASRQEVLRASESFDGPNGMNKEADVIR
ncbi:WD40-repeat-containing domain protein, partial [Thelonectria olida]